MFLLGSISKPSAQVDLHCYEVEQDHKLPLLQTMLREEQGSFLVFARTRHGADRLAGRLSREGVKTEYRDYPDMIHGFITMGRVLDTASAALEDCARVLRASWDA